MSAARTTEAPSRRDAREGRAARFCASCGAGLPAAARYCAECGATVPGAGATPAPPVHEGPRAPARRGRRGPLVALVALVAIAVGAGAAVVLLGGDSAREPAAPRAAPAQRAPARIERATVAAVVARYAAAYSAESVARLSALFAPGFERRNAGEAVQTRARALAAYARQFRALANPRYRVSGLAVTTDDRIASARGRYRITSDAGTVSGHVRFELATIGGSLLITRLTATPVAPAVTRAAVAALVDRYAAAYSAESVAGLRALFAPGFERRNGDDPAQGRAAALRAYAEQFVALTDPRYRVADLAVTTRRRSATASGRYTVTSAAGTVGGAIRFAMADTGGALLITAITTVPDSGDPGSAGESGGGEQPTPAPDTGGSSGGSSGGESGGGGGGIPYYLPQPYVPDLY